MSSVSVSGTGILELKAYVNSPNGQNTVNQFIECLRDELGSREKYESVCQKAELSTETFNEINFRGFMENLVPFMRELPPGHDSGHLYRDFLGSAALFTGDPGINKAKYKSDSIAGLFGFAHDIGNSLIHRYADKNMIAGHAEIGAWVVFNLMRDLFGREISMIAAYGIAAHGHLTKDLLTPGGFVRKLYWAELFDNNGLVGFAAKIMARGCDRLDTGGGVSQLVRDLLASADALEQGIKGYDIKGGSQDMEYFEVNRESLITKLKIEIRPQDARIGGPTILEHLDGYANTQIQQNPSSVYNQDDDKVPLLALLIKDRVERQWFLKNRMLGMMKSLYALEPGVPSYVASWLKFKSLARQISHADPWKLDRTFSVLERAWQEQNPVTLAAWADSIPTIGELYKAEVESYAAIIQKSGTFLSDISADILKRII